MWGSGVATFGARSAAPTLRLPDRMAKRWRCVIIVLLAEVPVATFRALSMGLALRELIRMSAEGGRATVVQDLQKSVRSVVAELRDTNVGVSAIPNLGAFSASF